MYSFYYVFCLLLPGWNNRQWNWISSRLDEKLVFGMAEDFEKFFHKSIKDKPPYAFQDKQSLIQEFLAEYKKTGRGIDVSDIKPEEYGQLYEQLIEGSSSLQDLLDDKEQISGSLWTVKQESEAMKQIDQQIKQLSNGLWSLRIGTNTLYDAYLNHKQTILPKNINQAMMCVKSFIAAHRELNNPDQLYLREQMDALTKDQYDNTEQVVINAVLKKTLVEYDSLLSQAGIRDFATKEQKKADLCRALWRHDINALENYSVLDPYSPQNLQQALELIESTFQQTSNVLTQDVIHTSLKRCVVSNKDMLDEYTQTSSLSASDKKLLRTGDFQQRNKKTQQLIKQLLKRQVAEKITKVVAQKTLDATIDTFATTNGSLKQIFKHYPPHEALANHPKLALLIDEMNILREKGISLPEDKKKREQLEEKKSRLEREIYLNYITTKQPALWRALTSLQRKKRNTEALSLVDQKTIMRAMATAKVDEVIANNIALWAWIKNPTTYKQMLVDMLDPDQKILTIPTRHGSKTIKFKHKQLFGSLEKYSHLIDTLSLSGGDDLNAFNQLQMIFQIDLDDAGSDFELLRKILPQGSFRSMNIPGAPQYKKTRDSPSVHLIHEGTKVDISGHQWYLSPIAPMDSLEQREGVQRDLTGSDHINETYYYLYDHPTNLPVSGGGNRDLVYSDIDKRKPVIIKKDAQGKLTRMDVSLDNTSQTSASLDIGSIKTVPWENILNISGNGIGALMRWATMLMSDDDDVNRQMAEKSEQAMQKFEAVRTRKKTQDGKWLADKTWEELMQAKENDQYIDRHLTNLEGKKDDLSDDTPELSAEALKTLIKKNIKGSEWSLSVWDQFVFQSNDSNWLWLTSEVPAWIRATVTSSGNWSITIRFNGTAKDMAKGEENKEYTFSLSKQQKWVLSIENLFDIGSRYGIVDHTKNYDMDSQIAILTKNESLSVDDAKLWNGLHRHKGIFRKREKPEEEIQSFAADVVVWSGWLKEKSKKVLYMYKKQWTSIEVSADIPLNDGTDKTWSYKRTMPYDAFVLMVSSLKLQPLTWDQHKAIIENKKAVVPDVEARKTERVWLRFVRKGIKTLRDKGIKKYFDDYDADEQEKADDFIYMHSWIGKGLQKLPFIWSWFKDVREEYEDGYYSRKRKKIEDKKKSFVDSADFGGVINDDILPHYLWTKTDDVKTIAWLLALLEKWRYPLISTANTSDNIKTPGQRILRILWPKHAERFEWVYQDKLAETQKSGNTTNTKLQNDLMKAELQYIINALRGELWIDDPHNTDVTKSLLYSYSKQLSWALENAMIDRENGSKVDKDSFDKKKGKTFPQVMNGFFNDEIAKGKTADCINSLKAMACIMTNDDDMKKFQMCMTALMLSWLAEHELWAVNKDELAKLSRKAWFPIGNWREDSEQRLKLSTMLDYITQWSFSQNVGYMSSAFDSQSYRIWVMKDFQKEWFFAKYKTRWQWWSWLLVSDFLTLKNLNNPKNIINIANSKDSELEPAIRPKSHELQYIKELEEAITQQGKKSADDVLNKLLTKVSPLTVATSAIDFIRIKDGDYELPKSDKSTQMAQEYFKSMKSEFDKAQKNPTKHTYQYLFRRFKETMNCFNSSDERSYAYWLAYYSSPEYQWSQWKQLKDNIMDTIFLQNAKKMYKWWIPSEMEDAIISFMNLTKKFLGNGKAINPPPLDDDFFKKQWFKEDALNIYKSNATSKYGQRKKQLMLPQEFQKIKDIPANQKTSEQKAIMRKNDQNAPANHVFQSIIQPTQDSVVSTLYSYTSYGWSQGNNNLILPFNRLAIQKETINDIKDVFDGRGKNILPTNVKPIINTEWPINSDLYEDPVYEEFYNNQ